MGVPSELVIVSSTSSFPRAGGCGAVRTSTASAPLRLFTVKSGLDPIVAGPGAPPEEHPHAATVSRRPRQCLLFIAAGVWILDPACALGNLGARLRQIAARAPFPRLAWQCDKTLVNGSSVRRRRPLSLLFALLACAACAAASPPPMQLPNAPLLRPEGEAVEVHELVGRADFTVLVFFSVRCHCLQLHEGRLKGLYEQFGPRGVQFVMIDSEADASPERDRAEALRRGYPFPILEDRGARLANELRAEYATYSVLLDRSGHVLYRGGIDTDKSHLRDDATPFLRNALDDVLSGHAPRLAEGKTLGCALQKW
jgi:hypothetical protein